MYLLQLSILASMATVALANLVPSERRATDCTTGAVVFLVRPSDLNQTDLGPNPRFNQLPPNMTNIANAIIGKAGGDSYSQAIQYPAINPTTGQYRQSVDLGIKALQKAIVDYVNTCRCGKIFVIGFSQGAEVVSDVLAGPLKAHGRFTGGVILADPNFHDGYFPIDAGSGANDGINGVNSGDGSKYRFLNKHFGRRVRSYCEAGDQVCDSGNGTNAHAIHLNAARTFQADAIAFLTAKV